MPDTFFRNEKIGAFHNILTPNLYIRVFPDGDVLYSIRISLTCFCSMYLALFPLDEQTCNLDIASCKFAKMPAQFLILSECLQNKFKHKNLFKMGGQRKMLSIYGKMGILFN